MKKSLILLITTATLSLAACSEEEKDTATAVVESEDTQEVQSKEVNEEVKDETTKESEDGQTKGSEEELSEERKESIKQAEEIKKRVEKESEEELQAKINAQVPTDASDFEPNYENTEGMVQAYTTDILNNLNRQLALDEGGPFTMEEIKTWFSDFDALVIPINEYDDKLLEKNMDPKHFTKIEKYFDEITPLENYAWKINMKKVDTQNDKIHTSYWDMVVKPDELGNLRIHKLEISHD
ncbi:hypothetical protein FZC79_14270 [Rossellomorea vietnamensis]|uniref:Lipoprotein n=1 Tax=Rossellomorea vietnamensis TaxID=218284 RepID=A0A5D4KBT0_9BACI|nr:hypothetical protein [Rossellomorea vietnamensis]TYR74632.1 hypothetical protein FZC79_14270 [Rossellomorea vietnamensis]